MTVAFPELCPTQRQWTPGSFPVRRFTAVNGAGVTRIYGNRAFDASLSLEYNLSDAELAELLECWNDAFGAFDTLTLPDTVFEGMSPAVRNQIPAYLSWRWAEQPRVTSVLAGRSTVTVNLIANLD